MTSRSPMLDAIPARVNNPFPGLRPFREEEEHLFFGREHQVDAMVDRLSTARFLAVVGTSGSGKSSLVNCGLRPALHRGLMSAAGSSWRIAQFRPGGEPIRSMISAMSHDGVLFTNYQGSIALEEIVDTHLRLSKRGLIDLFRKARLPQGTNLLVVVDQFEELFRYARLGAAAEAIAFVNLLLEARQQPSCPIYVVVTMRSDFLGDCSQFHGLPEAINAGQYLVPRMTREERRAAIAGPVGVGGAEIDPALLTRVVNDVGDNPDQLSILQHALNRTWAYWSHQGQGAGPLEIRHYEAIGAMAHALDQHAEKAYAELATPRRQQICEKIFKALTDKGTDARGIRRPTTFQELCALAEAEPSEVSGVIEVFRKPSRSFLMPPEGVAHQPQSIIDISHESLMRVWNRLNQWVDEEAESASQYRRLAESAALHARGGAGLMTDPELALMLDWRDRAQPNATWGARYHPGFAEALAFLEESRKARDAAIEAEERRRRAESQAAMARKWVTWLVAALLLAVAAAGWALVSYFSAEAKRRAANLETQRAEQQTGMANDQLKKALVLQANATKAAADATAEMHLARAKEAEAEGAVRTAAFLRLRDQALKPLTPADRALSLLLAARRYASSDKERDDTAFDIWGLIPGFSTGTAGNVLALAPDRRQALVDRGNDLFLLDSRGAAQEWKLDGIRQEEIDITRFSPDGSHMAIQTKSGGVRVWDLKAGSHRPVVIAQDGHHIGIASLAFSPGGDALIIASADAMGRVWSLKDGEPLAGPFSLGSSTAGIAVSPDPAQHQLASAAGNTALLDFGTGKPLGGHMGLSAKAVAYSSTGDALAVVDANLVAVFKPPAADVPIPVTIPLAGQERLEEIAYQPNGKYLAVTDTAGRIWLVDSESRTATGFPPPAPLPGSPVNRAGVPLAGGVVVAFSPSGKFLAAGYSNGRVALWDVEEMRKAAPKTGSLAELKPKQEYDAKINRITGVVSRSELTWAVLSSAGDLRVLNFAKDPPEDTAFNDPARSDHIVRIAAQKDLIAVARASGSVQVLRQIDGPPVQNLSPANAIALGDRRIAVLLGKRDLHVRDLSSGDEVFLKPNGDISSLVFSARRLLAGRSDADPDDPTHAKILAWDLNNLALDPVAWKIPAGGVHGLATAGQGDAEVLAVAQDNHLRQWRLSTLAAQNAATPLDDFATDLTGPMQIVMNADGSRALLSDARGNWRMASRGQGLRPLHDAGKGAAYRYPGFSLDGKSLLFIDGQGVSSKPLEPEEAVKLAQRFPLRELTAKECLELIGAKTCPASLQAPATLPIRIKAGTDMYLDPDGNLWLPDTYHTVGTLNPRPEHIAATKTEFVYQAERWKQGSVTVTIFGVPPGHRTVVLKFAELFYGVDEKGEAAGKRAFDIDINDQVVEKAFDVAERAGGPLKAVDVRYPVEVGQDGKVVIKFIHAKPAKGDSNSNNPKYNAIEIH